MALIKKSCVSQQGKYISVPTLVVNLAECISVGKHFFYFPAIIVFPLKSLCWMEHRNWLQFKNVFLGMIPTKLENHWINKTDADITFISEQPIQRMF